MIPIGLYRAVNVNKNSKPYVFLKPSADVKTHPKDKVYVLSIKQPKERNIDIEEENHSLNQQFPSINIKSKLQGEEGRIDAEIARQVHKVNSEISNFSKDLVQINEQFFHKNLTNPDLIPQIRSIFKQEISNLNLATN